MNRVRFDKLGDETMRVHLILLMLLLMPSMVRAADTHQATLIHPDPNVIRGEAFFTLSDSLLRYYFIFDSDGVNGYPATLLLGSEQIGLPITGGGVSIHFLSPDPEYSFPGRAVFSGETTLDADRVRLFPAGASDVVFGEWRGRVSAIPEPATWILAAIATLCALTLWWHRASAWRGHSKRELPCS